MNALDFKGEPTVKLAVELFAGLKGDVEFASAASVPLIKISGILETLAAGRGVPVGEILPE